MLFFVVGEVGVGKSAIAARAGGVLSLPVYEVDVLKASVYGSFPDYVRYRKAGALVPDVYRFELYREFLATLCSPGHTPKHALVVENFYTKPPRQVLYAAATRLFAGYKVIWVTASVATLQQRSQTQRVGHDLPNAWKMNRKLATFFQGVPEAELVLPNEAEIESSAQILADFVRLYLA